MAFEIIRTSSSLLEGKSRNHGIPISRLVHRILRRRNPVC